jgi:hypothetical protein
MPWFRPRDLLDQTFEVGIILKGLDGLFEVIGGLLLLVVSPATIDRLITSLTQHELSEDPHDVLATHLLRTAHGLTGSAVLFGAIYLLAHGLVKVILVTALPKNQLGHVGPHGNAAGADRAFAGCRWATASSHLHSGNRRPPVPGAWQTASRRRRRQWSATRR